MKSKEILFEYFTLQEANLFVFYRIPKEFFANPKYKKLSAEAKILYGLLLDRNGLSIQNGWVDEQGYVYIYFSREEAMEMLGIAKPKTCSIFKELNDAGLIREIRQGLNKPNIIYVGKFIPSNTAISTEVIKTNFQKSENLTSESNKFLPQKVRKIAPNNIELKETYLNENEKTHTVLKGNITPIQSEQTQEEQKAVCEPIPVSLEQSPAEMQADNDATFVREHLKKLVHTCSLERIRYHLEHWPETEEQTHTGQAKEEQQQPVCEQAVSLEALQQEIQAVIGETIVTSRLKKLVYTTSLERIRYHLAHWHIHRKNQTKKGAGYFITVVENDIPPVAPEKKTYATDKKPQRDNFDQREYTDEELEKFYANLT